MDKIFNVLTTAQKDVILTGIATTVIGGLILTFLLNKISIIKERLSSKPLPKPDKQAIYLNTPKRSFYDKCWGREKLLKKVLAAIKGNRHSSFTRKCIAIHGEEGIGKTLFCYTLFQDYLKGYPVYLGWIDCNGKQSIFDIIKTSFEDSRFHRKSKESILNTLKNLDNPCILFADQINQYTPLDELEELSQCKNVILILSGTLKKIDFVDDPYKYKLLALPSEIIRNIFEKKSGEEILLMKGTEKASVNGLLSYSRGNPFLTIAIAKAKCHYNDRWTNVYENVNKRAYNEENYLKEILRQLYRINELNSFERVALSKLSTIEYSGFVEAVFDLLSISIYSVKRLCNTYWLTQEDSILYSMDAFHRKVIVKVLTDEFNLKSAITSISDSLTKWRTHKDNGFKWISPYIEKILENIQGYAVHILDEELFYRFSYQVATKYENIYDKEKRLKWIELCKPQDIKFVYKKTYIELRAKAAFIDTLFSFSEVNQSYLEFIRKTETDRDYQDKKYLMQEYCHFLIGQEKYDDALSLCKKFFETNDFDLSNEDNCDMFFRYLQIANLLDDKETLNSIVNDAIIQDLYHHDKVSISAAWSFGELGEIYRKRGDKSIADIYIRHMVVLLNEQRCFFHDDIKNLLKYSDEEFAEYMHSCDELSVSLHDALTRKDAEALYIEGRFQEKLGDFEQAYILYEDAASRDSLRGMCSLALLYYRGNGVSRDYKKAQRYWEYCCERGHRGSYYWLGILLLDTDYRYPSRDYDEDRKKALQHLTKAAELGSERAKQKLSEL